MRFSEVWFRAIAAALAAFAAAPAARGANDTFASEVLIDRPIAYYRLNESPPATTAVDVSGNLLNGTFSPTGTTLEQAATAGDRGVDFSGGWIAVENQPLLNPELVSIEAVIVWHGATGAQQRICEKSTEPSGTRAVYNLCIGSDDTPLFEVDFGTGSALQLPSCVKLPTNRPIHLFATHDGTTMSLYVDGVLATSIRQPGTLNRGSTRPFAIGNQVERDRAFNGVIDELALYDHAVPAARVLSHARTIPELTGISVDCPDGGTGGTGGTAGTSGSGGTLGDSGTVDSGTGGSSDASDGSGGTTDSSGGSGATGGGDGSSGSGATGATAGTGGSAGVGGTGASAGGSGALGGQGGSGGRTGGGGGTGGPPTDGGAGSNDIAAKPTVDIDGGCACTTETGRKSTLALIGGAALAVIIARSRKRTR